MIAAPSLDELDEDFPHPAGADEWGPRYETDPLPASKTVALDAQGRYEIPSFIDRTVVRGEQECWVTDQTPAATTIVMTCPRFMYQPL